MQVDLAGRVALVADDESGVARAVARALARNGARVVAADRNAPFVAEMLDRFGRLDILVVCAADYPEAAAGLIRAVSQKMRMAGAGRIVTIVSIAGVVPLRGDAARAAAQSGLIALTRALSLELAGAGVLVNVVATGAVQDDGGAIAEADRRMLSHIPLARAGTPAEIADAVLFLVDPANSYTTGHVLSVDGGWSAGFGRDF